MKKFLQPIFYTLILFTIPSLVWAQEVVDTDSTDYESIEFLEGSERLPIQLVYLNDKIKEIIDELEQRVAQKTASVIKADLSDDDKTVLTRIADIYRLHVLSLESQINNDALSTERYITNSINELQQLLVDYPDIQQHRRFTGLYRTVMTEYRGFYGDTETGFEEEGEIFAIQKDLFSEDQLDLDADNFSIPNSLKNERKFAVQLPQNKYVNSQLAYLWMKKPEIMDTWLQRKERYFPMMEKIFEEEKVPKELMHLAMIESGLNPMARSKAAAVGMWQFIKATGAAYGLEVNYWVDDRRDPVKSTRAAARHLNDLYKVWGDWHLALANYNVSPRRMKYAVRNSGGVKDYWVIYPYLPRETRGYVPIFIATVMIATNPEEFGFKSKYGTQDPFEYETVDVIGSYDLKLLAEAAGISEDELKEYNPALLRWATPPGNFAYPLRLPVGAKETFVSNFKNVPVSAKKEQIFVHNVKKGETLGRIARKYGVTVRDLYESNDKLGKVIRIGQEIMVPIPAGKSGKVSDDLPAKSSRSYASSSNTSYGSRPANSTKIVYVVKRGDTVGEIAEWFKTRASNIRSWNGTSNTIRVGQKLSVYVPNNRASLYSDINSMSNKEKNELGRSNSRSNVNLATSDADGFVTYKVQSNDNLYDIANSFGISINDIKRLNKLRKNTIFPGQVLKIKEK